MQRLCSVSGELELKRAEAGENEPKSILLTNTSLAPYREARPADKREGGEGWGEVCVWWG